MDQSEHPSSLVPGPAARARHRQKVAQLLPFLLKVHLCTTHVVGRLFGLSSSNASRLLNQLVRAKLVREVEIAYAVSAPRGKGFMLTPEGVTVAARAMPEKGFDYDCRPESIRQAQVEHDLFLAEFAANWIRYGGELLETDYTQRVNTKQGKIPDLILRYDRFRIAVEFERLVKKRRELDGAILASYQTHRLPTIWLSPNAAEVQYLRHAVHVEQTVDKWKLNSGHKWSKDGYQPLLLWFRARQLFVTVEPDVMLRTPEQWIHQMDKSARAIQRTAVEHLYDVGWSWGKIETIDWDGQTMLQFELRIDAMMASAVYIVTKVTDDGWKVCRADQTPSQGVSLIERFKWTGKEGDEPPADVVELATWRIRSLHFQLPN